MKGSAHWSKGMWSLKFSFAIAVAISLTISFGAIVAALFLIGDACYTYIAYHRSKEIAEGKRVNMWS